MAAKLVCNGTVLEKTRRDGTNDRGPWSFTTARVLTGKSDVVEVRFSSDYPEDLPREGEDVSLLVDVSVYNAPGRQGRLSIDAVRSTTDAERLGESAGALSAV